jgi:hypothetical protein
MSAGRANAPRPELKACSGAPIGANGMLTRPGRCCLTQVREGAARRAAEVEESRLEELKVQLQARGGSCFG